MIRNLAAISLTLGALTPAHAALRLSTTGQGQALYLPYFSAEDGRSTLLSISNDDLAAARAVRLVVSESRNGRVLLGATVYLLPGAAWNGAILAERDEAARLVGRGDERSCLLADSLVFSDQNFRGANDDGYGLDIARTRSGAIEAIEIGTPRGAALAALEAGACAQLEAPAAADIGAPAGRLSLAAELLEARSGRLWSYDAVALEGFSRTARLESAMLRITDPQPDQNGRFEVLYPAHDGRVHTAVLPGEHPEDAASLALASWALVGDYALSFDDSVRAEWVLAFPTRHAYVDDRPGGVLASGSGPRAPFRGACDTVPIVVRGRDGEALASPIRDTSDALRVCDQVTHLALRRPLTLIPESGNGRVWIDLADLGRARLPGTQHFGLPVLGLALQSLQYQAPRGEDVSRSFAGAHPLRRYAARDAVKDTSAREPVQRAIVPPPTTLKAGGE